MKKALLFFASLSLIAIIFASCKTHERCPAYGKVTNQTEQKTS